MFLPSAQQDPDASIRLTDTDAAVARLSAVQKQYVQDPFIKHFVSRANLQPPRPPLINIGTFVRSSVIDSLVEQWLSLSGDVGQCCQIISFGCGSDTRFWRIATGAYQDNLATYIEIDFPEITSKKAMSIRKSRELSSVLGNPANIHLSQGGTLLHAQKYHLIPADLRLPPSSTIENLLCSPTPNSNTEAILSPTLPTLLLFECVLVYMSPASSSALMQWFVDYFSRFSGGRAVLAGIVYEMFGLGDSFGQVMVNNLKTRNVSLPGAEPYQTVNSLPSRFLDAGFTTARALTLREIRRTYIDPKELERISRLEMLDEVEELDLMLEHYAVTWGLLRSNPDKDARWGDWGLKMLHQANPDNTSD